MRSDAIADQAAVSCAFVGLLGRPVSGEAVIVDAKAHLNELYSPEAARRNRAALIQASLSKTTS